MSARKVKCTSKKMSFCAYFFSKFKIRHFIRKQTVCRTRSRLTRTYSRSTHITRLIPPPPKHQCNNHYGIQEYYSNKDSVNASLFSGGPTAKDYTWIHFRPMLGTKPTHHFFIFLRYCQPQKQTRTSNQLTIIIWTTSNFSKNAPWWWWYSLLVRNHHFYVCL